MNQPDAKTIGNSKSPVVQPTHLSVYASTNRNQLILRAILSPSLLMTLYTIRLATSRATPVAIVHPDPP